VGIPSGFGETFDASRHSAGFVGESGFIHGGRNVFSVVPKPTDIKSVARSITTEGKNASSPLEFTKRRPRMCIDDVSRRFIESVPLRLWLVVNRRICPVCMVSGCVERGLDDDDDSK